MRSYTLWTDGSCLGAPGTGGWCCVCFKRAFGRDFKKPYSILVGSALQTTNNRMEMKAVIEGLKSVPEASHVKINSDSSYVIDGCTRWHQKWIQRRWKGVANVDLWHELLDLIATHKFIEFKKIKGHTGVDWNEVAHNYAKRTAKARDCEEVGRTNKTERLEREVNKVLHSGGIDLPQRNKVERRQEVYDAENGLE